jgi:ATP-binding cassette subfamily F protein uup
MHLLSVQNLSKHYGNKTLFSGAGFTLSPFDRVGLVGVNGSGKTTLLRMIVGLEPPDSGTIERNPKARLAYLPQNPEMDDELTVLDYLFQGETPTVQLLRTYESAVLALAKNPNDPVFQERLANLSQRMDLEGGWAAEARVKAVLTRLGLTEFEAPLGALSGGQRRRAAIARVLIDPADLLILDEPTNHLDPDTIVWLEDYLADFKTALLLVTHDRYFLDRAVSHILEIDQAQIQLHPGNYSLYLERQAARAALRQKYELDRRNILQRELAWLRRSPMARGGQAESSYPADRSVAGRGSGQTG